MRKDKQQKGFIVRLAALPDEERKLRGIAASSRRTLSSLCSEIVLKWLDRHTESDEVIIVNGLKKNGQSK